MVNNINDFKAGIQINFSDHFFIQKMCIRDRPTSDYLNKILNYIVFIGAGFLAVIAVIPIFFAGVFSIQQVSFGGTSIIIIVGVALETIKQVESQMLVRNYKGFLND